MSGNSAILAAHAFGLIVAALGETTVITVPGVGRIHSNSLPNGIVEALNIPYADSAAGHNRFRPPQPWTGPTDQEINGTAYGPLCVQPATLVSGIVLPPMSEDCLSLNIWTPQPAGHLPVFVFIHGGGFLMGGSRAYNGSNLAARGSVVVTPNYRLGVFGYLPLAEIAKENVGAPGNGGAHGFLDQLAALKWLQKHVASFGGDPHQVTIGGESAGSLSVCAHLHIPAAQGLFLRAAMESGSCVGPWGAWSNSSQGKVEDLFRLSVGAWTLAALRNESWENLVKSPFWALVTPSPDGWWLKKETAELPVLTSGTQVIVGSNTMDSLFGPPWNMLGLVVPKTRIGYEFQVTSYFGREALRLYPAPAHGIAEDYRKAFIRINTDVCNTCPKHWIAQKLRKANNTVFAYNFGYWPNTTDGGKWKGLACHGCETNFVFESELGKVLGGPVGNYSDSYYNIDLAHTMGGYWTSFIASGIPRGAVAWPEYSGNLNSSNILKFADDEAGKPTITQSRPLEIPQCEFFQRFWDASAANQDRMNEFCTLPLPHLAEAKLQQTSTVV